MRFSSEEKNILAKLASGVLDGQVGDDWTCGRGSTCWFDIVSVSSKS